MTTLSAIVCTHNRGESLLDTVRSLLDQTLADSFYEVLVVDNGSTDTTAETLRSLMSETGNVRYVCEPELGLSIARNRGLAESEADLVAYIDDDAIASPTWLAELVRGYEENVAAAAIGGRIELAWPGPPPPWYSVALRSCFSGLDLGTRTRILSYPQFPYGTNISFRRQLLVDVGGFSSSLGRKGGRLLSMEEADVCWRLQQRGHRTFYVPSAVVHHRVDPHRISPRWVLRRSYYDGLGEAIFERVSRKRPLGFFVGRMVIAPVKMVAIAALMVARLARTKSWAAVLLEEGAHLARWAGFFRQCLLTLSRPF